MNAAVTRPPLPFARAVAGHSLGWMVAANAVGVWLGLSLLWPALGEVLAPFTYGRWVPLHLNWQLYGSASLPLVGVLLAWYLDPQHARVGRHAQVALTAWTLALLLGGASWLGGVTSGKPFLDWHGWARPLLPAAMHVLWALLAAHTWWRWRTLAAGGRTGRVLLLACLLAVPTVLQWSAGRQVYPAVNPDSGGATGSALLGSTLGIVTLYLMLPAMLGLGRRSAGAAGDGSTARSWPVGSSLALAASWLVFALIDHGHTSHHAPAQMAGLAVLIIWIPLLPAAWARWEWPPGAGAWRAAAAGWWALLVLSGWLAFLPGISERLKFTHGLVAHSHLAMAGLVTSVNAAVLVVLTGRAPSRAVFWLWQLGCAVLIGATLVLGGVEVERTADLFRSEGWTQGLLAARLAGGLAMTVASAVWLRQGVGR